MRVDPSGTYPALTPTADPAPRPAGQAPASVSAASAFRPTTDLANLLSVVRRSPDVRADVIRAVAARLAAGEFATPEAAADAARALLGPTGG